MFRFYRENTGNINRSAVDAVNSPHHDFCDGTLIFPLFPAFQIRKIRM